MIFTIWLVKGFADAESNLLFQISIRKDRPYTLIIFFNSNKIETIEVYLSIYQIDFKRVKFNLCALHKIYIKNVAWHDKLEFIKIY